MLASDEVPMAHEFDHEDDRDHLDPYIDGIVPTPLTPEERGFALGMLIGDLRRIYAAYDEDGEDLSALPAKAADAIDRLIDQVAKNADAEEMADVGRALMKAIEVHAYSGWGPAQCPSEIVGDLRNECDELRAEVGKLKAIVKSNQNCGCAITPCAHDREFAARDIDAERYRKLRNDDNWGEDTCRESDSAWKILGHLSGEAFDDFIDSRFALRGAA